jgi:hypothetical protein
MSTRSFFFFANTLKASNFKTAQAVAEFGASELVNKLNQDSNGFLLVTQPACWQSSAIDTEGLFQANPRANIIEGIPNNTISSKQWRVIPLLENQTQTQALNSGSYARYQLKQYRPPERISQNNYASFESTCPSDPFANRFGGSAYLTIQGELYRNNSLRGRHIITQEIHVAGLGASSTGETSMVLTNGGELNTSTPWIDLNNNQVKDDNEPWIDIHCVYCTGTTQTELKTQNPPIGVGMQGTLANNYQGTIITGNLSFPRFRFEDSNLDGKIGTGETSTHSTLRSALASKIDVNNPPDLDSASTTFPYKSGNFSDSNLVDQCAVATDTITDSSNQYDYIGCIVNRVDLSSGGKKNKKGKSNASVVVRTDQTNGRPVYIFVQSNSQSDAAVSLNGQESIINYQPDSPLNLGLFGLPPTTTFPNQEPSCNGQDLEVTGTESLSGIWTWFPRGSLNFGAGNPKLSGLLWVCNFDGRGNLKFMGSNQDISGAGCGVNRPCGLYKYRAKGIAQVDRERL